MGSVRMAQDGMGGDTAVFLETRMKFFALKSLFALSVAISLALPIGALAIFVGLRAFAKWMSHKTAEHSESDDAQKATS